MVKELLDGAEDIVHVRTNSLSLMSKTNVAYCPGK